MKDKIEFHPIRTVLAYWWELLDKGSEFTIVTFTFLKTLFLFITLPIWYPFVFVLDKLLYPCYTKKVDKARKEHMDRMFPDKEKKC